MDNEQISGSGEDRLIARYFKPLATHPGALGLIDDAAALAPPPGCDLVLKADAIVGGVHFFADDPAGTIAQKALRVNLSDLAAKGAQPLGFLLTLALPSGIEDGWLAAFAQGLGADGELFKCPLLGGDTVRTPGPVTVSIAVFGTVPHRAMVRRDGAKPGDRVLVSGTIGDSALGLLLRRDGGAADRWQLSAAEQDHLRGRFLVPQPRLPAIAAIARHASAGMDVSDGLAGDLAKLCRASRVDAKIASERVPLSRAARAALTKDSSLIEPILTGGDDYEVLLSVAPERAEALSREAAAAGVVFTDIGEIGDGAGNASFVGADGKALTFARSSFSHF